MTPLYKRLKANGTSFYAFPGAAEDISAAYNNTNYKMYFSKYVLLNFPKQNVNTGTNSNPIYWDFQNIAGQGYGFKNSISYQQPENGYQEQLIESLRNYVANQEVVIKESKLNDTEFYYDNTILTTPTEKIFWKWCRKLNLLSLEPAIDGDEYFGNLLEFERFDPNDTEYFPEILWREREVIDYEIYKFRKVNNNLQLEFRGETRFQVGDVIEINDITSLDILPFLPNNSRAKIVSIEPASGSDGQKILTSKDYTDGPPELEQSGNVFLVHHRLVQYIGEINGVNNVQAANKSYTEVYAHIPDSTGQTPDVLFRTKIDRNYRPNLTFPILPSQYQPEIMGAEVFSNPIVSSPDNYPGSYYGQFDTLDFTYETASGDSLRRSGDYYGISGNIDTPTYNTSNIDGLSLDFDVSHYVKMNILSQELTNFDQFNALEINNQPPKDFEFNAILWYYTVEDNDGNIENNLYGISFVDHPDNNPIPSEAEAGSRIPAFRKLAANDLQDGISYAFSLNLNFNIINENPQDTYNPEAINSLFSFNIYNEAMRRLSGVNDSFMNILLTQNQLQTDVSNMKQLLYTQTDFNVINRKIANLELLLRLYSTNQMESSDSIQVVVDDTSRPPLIRFKNLDPSYDTIIYLKSSEMYSVNGSIPYLVTPPTNKSFLIYFINDDLLPLVLPNEEKLRIIITQDLSHKQSIEFVIDANTTATQNKKLEIYVQYLYAESESPVLSQLIETIDLPIYYNTSTQLLNSSAISTKFNFQIDLNKLMSLEVGGQLFVPLVGNGNLISNSVKKGDILYLNDFLVGTFSTLNFSSQYKVDSVGITNSYIYLDASSNNSLINYGLSQSLPVYFNDPTSYKLSNYPYFSLNKGFRYKVTRIDPSGFSSISDRYYVEKFYLES
jgi:hypothetical protein